MLQWWSGGARLYGLSFRSVGGWEFARSLWVTLRFGRFDLGILVVHLVLYQLLLYVVLRVMYTRRRKNE